ncbi:MAG: 50S ribosomal protein L23 [Planctomycetota bacterium]|nr:50S ribosomal protein L23 [Planctomycetota bacterium]
MQAHQVIKKPLLTEKSTFHSDVSKRFSFEVAPEARKDEIKAAIQELYKVRVLSVNTVTRRGRYRRMRYGMIPPKFSKKAIVRIHPDDVIELV